MEWQKWKMPGVLEGARAAFNIAEPVGACGKDISRKMRGFQQASTRLLSYTYLPCMVFKSMRRLSLLVRFQASDLIVSRINSKKSRGAEVPGIE